MPVDEAVGFGFARPAQQDIGLGGFVGKDCGRCAVGEAARGTLVWIMRNVGLNLPDYDHKEGRQDLWQAEDDVGHDRPEL